MPGAKWPLCALGMTVIRLPGAKWPLSAPGKAEIELPRAEIPLCALGILEVADTRQVERSEVGISRPTRSRVFAAANTERDLSGAGGHRGQSPLKKKEPRLTLSVGVPKSGSGLLSHLVGQYHRRW